ncbi:thioesterase [Aureimonas sp. SA4125]|uniref:thioesterase family protein n=1 Tax=Aureimonas sp. SA4125 TaxID=2826993 RepID=UPI001CC7F3FB|nr:thioesterase family protein [Aureimonas sp. SA4125]BDA85549.1 thioesterase [Aureimonas sp. SA4125]
MTQNPPHRSSPLQVKAEWIDFNGHMNLAYYHVLFDQGVDEEFAALGLGAAYAKSRGMTTYVAENHVCYIREVFAGDIVTITGRIIDFDEKRLHVFQEMRHCDGWLAATLEGLVLSIDMSGPKVAPWPADILANISAAAQSDAALPRPDQLGRSIGIARKST